MFAGLQLRLQAMHAVQTYDGNIMHAVQTYDGNII